MRSNIAREMKLKCSLKSKSHWLNSEEQRETRPWRLEGVLRVSQRVKLRIPFVGEVFPFLLCVAWSSVDCEGTDFNIKGLNKIT